MRFDAMPMHPDVLDALDAMGFEEATPIQEQAIPTILQGKDFLGIAQTGTGKTAAFLLPTIDRILDTEDNGKTKALIVVPPANWRCKSTKRWRVWLLRQGHKFGHLVAAVPMISAEKKGLDRWRGHHHRHAGSFLSHLTLGYVDLSELQCLILDEADRMLDMGFVGDIMRIAEKCRDDRQTLLFSATMPDRIEDRPVTSKGSGSRKAGAFQAAEDQARRYGAFDHQKDEVLVEVLKDGMWHRALCSLHERKTVGQVIRVLRKAGIKCERISSDSEQSEREEVMLGFRQRKFPILVATDVVSRGIDIDNIELVVNYDVPPNEEDYVHRIGRTARANRDGEGITLVNPDDQQRFGRIERLIERSVDKLDLPGKVGKGPEYDP